MCSIMENRIYEEKTELAKEAIRKGNLSPEQIADVLKLPLTFVQELENTIAENHSCSDGN